MQNFTAAQLARLQSLFAEAEADSIPGDWLISLPASKITGTLSTSQLADGSVTTPKLADSAVTEIKLGNLSVTAAKLGDLAVTLAKLAAEVYASKVEAEAGVENTKLMTPLRVAEAIAALAPTGAGVDGSLVAIDPATGTSKTYTFTAGILTSVV